MTGRTADGHADGPVDGAAGEPLRALRQIDVAAWCRAGRRADGRLSLAVLPRLAASVLPDPPGSAGPGLPADAAAGGFGWSAAARLRSPVGREPELRLRLVADGVVRLTCQRCLEPVETTLQVDRTLRFVADEGLAERLDEASEDEDVLVLQPRTDLVALLEDELILALPLVPMHGQCPVDLAAVLARAGEPVAVDEEPHAFAALAALRGKPPPS